MYSVIFIFKIIAIVILEPIVGGLLAGLDRIISARMQGRVGPPILQPFYDVFKLFQKESIEVNRMHRFIVFRYLHNSNYFGWWRYIISNICINPWFYLLCIRRICGKFFLQLCWLRKRAVADYGI